MNSQSLRALVVDDELLVRTGTVRALSEIGFVCEEARDGTEAFERLKEKEFDLLVTDLRMPTQNGYRLALAVLDLEPRPFIAVLTGVADPRIAQDLLQRGVEDIVFKPISYDIFAVKVKALMDRRQQHQKLANSVRDVSKQATKRQIGLVELGKKISEVSEIFPISQAALDVFNMTSSGSSDAGQIADLIECDAALTAQILKLVNSTYYNRSGHGITLTKDAVVRVGQQQIGELALAHNALSALANSELPWLDTNLSWKRSLAAGVAMEQLVAAGHHSDIEGGLHNAAIMHPLGRVVLGALFPDEYETMIEKCKQSNSCLRLEEQQIFPVPHGHVLTNVLQSWGVPTRATRPLTQLHASYDALDKLAEPERTRTQLLKVAIYFARLAVGKWEPWDMLEIPPADVLEKLSIADPGDLVKQISEDVDLLCKSGIGSVPTPRVVRVTPPHSANRPLAFYDVAGNPFSTTKILLSQMGRRIDLLSDPAHVSGRALVLDCLASGRNQLPAWAEQLPRPQCVIVTAQKNASEFSDFENVVALPTSITRLEQCLDAAVVPQVEPVTA